MAVIVDTSVLIDHLRDDRRATDVLRTVHAGGERLVASILTKAELIVGMREGEQQPTQRFFGQIEWIDVTDGIAVRAGTLARQFKASHRGIDLIDCVIAATAIALDAPLLTRNVKHFPMFERLQSPY